MSPTTLIAEISTTVETIEHAQQISRHLVQSRLAACVQIDGPVTSIYRWQGEVCEGSEFRLRCKTLDSHVDDAVAELLKVHPYETPEILVDRVDASSDYLAWLRAQVGD